MNSFRLPCPIQHGRVVHKDNTVRWDKLLLQIEPTRLRSSMADLDVIVYQHLDGTLGIGYGPHTVGCYTAAIREDHQSGGLLQGGRMKDFRQLKVWQRALHLTLAIYHLTASFPRDEIYGLTSQDAAGRHIDPREFS